MPNSEDIKFNIDKSIFTSIVAFISSLIAFNFVDLNDEIAIIKMLFFQL